MTNATTGKKVYSLVVDPKTDTTGTGLDQIVDRVFADPGLAGANDSIDIKGGASNAHQMNQIILQAAEATGASADKVFTVDDVVKMNTWIRDNARDQWTRLHGDDENGSETGYHLVQNDGANINYRGENFVNTVADGIYHMGFEIRDGRFLNEDGDPNASVQQVADWLTQFYVDHSTTGTGLDKITDLVMADKGLDCKIPDAEIAKGADAADGMNQMLAAAIKETGILADKDVSAADVVALNAYLRDPARADDWAKLHGDDEKGSETGFHLVQNDGASTTLFGQNFVNTVADGIYHLGFEIKDGRLLNEDGDANAKVSDVASWLNYFVGDQSTTGTGLDRIVDWAKADPGLVRNTSAADIVDGLKAADAMNHTIADLIAKTDATADGWITQEEVRAMNGLIRQDADALKQWTMQHGDDEGGSETGYHLIQNDGANTNFLGQNLVNTVADGIYHMGFEIKDGRFLNEDGDPNATVADVATWLNYFYNEATIVNGDGNANALAGDQRAEQINAGGGDDTVNAGAGNDLVYGSWGNDILAGEDGNDLIYGGSGNDKVAGGNGDDVFRVTGTKAKGFEGYDSYDGGAGTDKIVVYGERVDIGVASFAAGNGVEVIDASEATSARVVGDWKDNVLDFSGVSFVGKVTIDGGGGNDTIIGSTGNDIIDGGTWGNQTIAGGAGNDVIHAGGGNDKVAGGNGDDVFRVTGTKAKGFEGYDSYDGGAGTDKIVVYGEQVDIGVASFAAGNGVEVIDASEATGGARVVGDWKDNVLDFSGVSFVGKVTIDGGGGNDTVIGSAGNDIIDGGTWGNQTIAGGAGNDVIHAGGGSDKVSGGDGDDVFRVTGISTKGFEGYDSYDGGAGTDKIVVYGERVDIGVTSFAATNGIEAIDASAAAGGARVLGDWKDNVLDFSGVSFVGKVTIDGGGGKDTIVGSAGDDVIEGGRWGEQTISGGAGNDVIHAGGSNDTVSGGDGDDVFRVTGSASKGFEGYDRYDGGAGTDTIEASGGNVDVGMKAFGTATGVEVIDFSKASGAARILGDWTDNVFDFSATTIVGKASIDAGGGNDVMIGSVGNDVMLGNWGNDQLNGGRGDDLLTGGGGVDVFRFGADWGRDTVTDFKRGTDWLDLRDAGVKALADLSITQVGGNTEIALGDDVVVLQGVKSSLTASDFIFA